MDLEKYCVAKSTELNDQLDIEECGGGQERIWRMISRFLSLVMRRLVMTFREY